MKVERVRVGDVLTLQRRLVDVDPTVEYNEIGVRSFGRGIFHKEPVSGATLGNKRVFEIHQGDLVLSNVFAWEGAIAVASDRDIDRIGSHRFMTYVPIGGRIDPRWAAWFFVSEGGLELIRKASPGSAGRNRTLAIERFEALQIPLPRIDEQRRVAAMLDRVRAFTAERLVKASNRSDALAGASFVACQGVLVDWIIRESARRAPLEEFGTWSSGGTPSANEPTYYGGNIPWAVIGDLNDGVVTYTATSITQEGLDSSSAKIVPAGSVLIAMYGASIGKTGIAGTDLATNQAIACCTPTLVSPEFLQLFIRCVRPSLVALGKGGAQPNISQTILKEFRAPVPDPSTEDEFARRASKLFAQMTLHEELVQRRRSIRSSIVPSLLNQAFAGLL